MAQIRVSFKPDISFLFLFPLQKIYLFLLGEKKKAGFFGKVKVIRN